MKKRKKIAILLPWLKIGGTNKICVNFINELIQYCDVTLILSQNTGEFLDDLSDDIEIIVDNVKDVKELFFQDLKKINIVNIYKDLKYYYEIKKGRYGIKNYKYIAKRNSVITDEYFDCAISYHGQSPERLLNLIYRIKANKKIAWIHGEISFSDKECKDMEYYYNKLDHFYFVSNHTFDSFLKKIKIDKSKGEVYYNPIDKQDIFFKSMEVIDTPYPDNVYKLLTVGRISKEKGQLMIPKIAYELKKRGYKFMWYIIGDGDLRLEVQNNIENYKVCDCVKILGVRKNPYSYMLDCDIYIQPSYTEGYSTTICEAGILGKPIIGTEPSGGIHDQIINGYDGYIVNATELDLTNGIEKLLKNKNLRYQFGKNIAKKNFEGEGEINKFLAYINDK